MIIQAGGHERGSIGGRRIYPKIQGVFREGLYDSERTPSRLSLTIPGIVTQSPKGEGHGDGQESSKFKKFLIPFPLYSHSPGEETFFLRGRQNVTSKFFSEKIKKILDKLFYWT